MYDKTILKQWLGGCLVLASNDNLKGQIDTGLVFIGRDVEEAAKRISVILSLSEEDINKNNF